MLDSIGDYGQAFDIARNHFAMGFAGVATDTVKMVRTVNPFDAYNQAHPAEYLKNSTQLGAGLVHAAANPEELVKGFVGTGWSKDPAQASGALTANIMSLVAPGPKGAGALSGAGRVAGAAGRDAAAARLFCRRSATTTGARDAAAAAGRGLSDAKPGLPGSRDRRHARRHTVGGCFARRRTGGRPPGHRPPPAKAEPTTQPVSHQTEAAPGRDASSDGPTSSKPETGDASGRTSRPLDAEHHD